MHTANLPAKAFRNGQRLLKHGSAPRGSNTTVVARRSIQIRPATVSDRQKSITDLPASQAPASFHADSPDARFEILGSPFSLLSVSISASQNLYTRRGTLVAISGKGDNVTSTLSLLEPFRRALLGIPFLYQKISSPTPTTALISTRSSLTSFAIVHLDGTVDWMVAQRKALLAWTGHSISIRPTLNRKLSIAHWGDSEVTGRGLLALSGYGQVYQVVLKAGEEFIAHPSNIVAYTITPTLPLPFRFLASSFRFQVPEYDFTSFLHKSRFLRTMLQTQTWKTLSAIYFKVRTWSRRTIWGDRLFVRFVGPSTILLQTRASRLNDVLTDRNVNELAETESGSVQSAADILKREDPVENPQHHHVSDAAKNAASEISYVTVEKDGKVHFDGSRKAETKI